LTAIETFYNSPEDEKPQALDVASHRKPVIDRRFQEKVWAWLTRNPEVSVGRTKEGNGLTLSEAEAAESSPSDTGTLLTDPQSQVQPSLDTKQPLRVFVSRERAWLAITGHEPDESKVLPTEFALLSIIASRKSRGIVQTDLVKLSGQDKRSVPKRTEMLQRKGYIEKRAVQAKSARTSLCTLRKFVPDTPAFHATETPRNRGSGRRHEAGDIIDFKVFLKQLFEILQEYKVISRNDLKKVLGFADGWRWRILSRALRKLERIGCLKRVKAMSQYQDTMKTPHPCVMLIRDPSERDIQLFHEDSRSLFANLEQEDKNNPELDDDIDAVALERESSTLADSGTPNVVRKDVVEDSGRILPRWSPDKIIHNLIFDVIDSASTTGRTNHVSCR
jgi:B-block binding subunit of TFIIIC